jgi:enamine deaminase RidA (YjgF/YER057c/UK114 family)
VITRLNPPGLHETPGYHHITIVEAGRTAYLAGQCPLDPSGAVPDGLVAQTDVIITNSMTALEAIGAGPEDVVKTVIYVASPDRSDLAAAWRQLNDSPLGPAFSTASTLLGVAQLGFTGQLIELDLTVALPG